MPGRLDQDERASEGRAVAMSETLCFRPGGRSAWMVDQRSVPVAAALVATSVPASIHTVVFRYVGCSSYLVLLLLGGLSVVSLAIVDRTRRRATATGGTPRLS